MTADDPIQKWISTWRQAELALRAVRIHELQDENYYLNHRDLLNSMLQYAYDHHTVRTASGLIALQSIFKQIHSSGNSL